ncbi:MAG: SMP-30/gluconolactonase/LRE family protein [Phycisphaerales bacterium]|nr:SMP-30/gluconolactonase/LRE family protein [Phycisphaerales bacterium]
MRYISPAALLLFSLAAQARPSQSPPLPDAVVDLRAESSAAIAHARWRFVEARVVDAENRAPGADLKPSGAPVSTRDISPRLGSPDFDSAAWVDISPDSLELRRTNGKLSFGWYRVSLTIPQTIGGFSTQGSSVVFEVTADDYSEVWVDGRQQQILGASGSGVIRGWNAPQRVVIDTNTLPGATHDIALFVANGPLSSPPSNYVWIRSATLDFYKPGRLAGAQPVESTITRGKPAFDAIFPPGTQIERIADGFSFTEGPVWVPLVRDLRYGAGGSGGYLLFSDPNKNVIHRWDPSSGEASVFRTNSGYSGLNGANIGEYHQPGSNGLALDPQGRLTICEHGNRRITRLEPNGSITVLADRYEGNRLNSPNDLVYRSDGTLYFTDPPYGLPHVYDDPRKELPYSGVFCLYNGQLKLVSTDLKGPNGLAFSPDEKYLYVDNWDEQKKVILRYEVSPSGELSNPFVFADLTSIQSEICFDGLKVDSNGNVYASGPGGIWVFDASGQHLGTFSPPELPANFAFGEDDGRTLFMTARTGVYRVRLPVSGLQTR